VIRRAIIHTVFVAALLLIIAAAIFFIANRSFRPELSFSMYLLINFIFCIDFIDLLVRLYLRSLYQARSRDDETEQTIFGNGEVEPAPLRPYAVIASVHNAEESIPLFLDHMKAFHDRLWVIDDASVDDTFGRLLHAGVHAIRGHVNRKKPGALRHLLRNLPRDIETVLVLDPDAVIVHDGRDERQEVESVIRDFQASGAAALSPRVVLRPDGMLARIQELEYALALSLGRKSLGDHTITSGVAIYRRDALEKALNRHTLSVYAEDLQNALILLGEGEKIYYDERLVVETEGKRTFRGWFSQRVGWLFGLIKVYTENFDDGRRAAEHSTPFSYQFFVYTGAFSLLFHPIRLLLLAQVIASFFNAADNALAQRFATPNVIPDISFTDPKYFVFGYLTYTMLALVAGFLSVRFRELFRLLPAIVLFFPYCLVHIVPMTIGYLNWITLKVFGHRVYRDHFQDEASLKQELESRA
jgi:cellulose synthase/poly-beta-1,6-N-acetylglucosamine synthase-like glycosyltransferase